VCFFNLFFDCLGGGGVPSFFRKKILLLLKGREVKVNVFFSFLDWTCGRRRGRGLGFF
jgi:hypothetical protein